MPKQSRRRSEVLAAVLATAVVVMLAAGRRGHGDDGAGGFPGSSPAPPAGPGSASGGEEKTDVLKMPACTRWQTFTAQDGLPADKAFCVKADGKQVWVGTDHGLACYEGGRWRAYGTEDGMPFPVVLALDASPRTGDLWIGTMGGLARLSGGRFDVFRQTDSGLSNDFVHAVRCDPDDDFVWAATAMGASRLDLRTGEWTIFTEQNTPMREPWTYSIAIDRGLVYVGAWGAGVLEYETRTGRWREYRDPDGDMEIDLFPDDGPIHDVTAGVDYRSGVLWQATYFGAARYDGRHWRTYRAVPAPRPRDSAKAAQDPGNSGLASNFIQFVRAKGRIAWMATDNGLSATDGEHWVTYRRLETGQGEILFYDGATQKARQVTPTALAHNFVLGVDLQGDTLWVATARGVSRGAAEASSPEDPLHVPGREEGAMQP